MWRTRRIGIVGLVCAGVLASAPSWADEVKVDRYEVVKAAASKDVSVVLRDFSVENTDFGKMKKENQQQAAEIMRNTAPLAFREAFVRQLGENATFAGIEALAADADVPEGALIVEGEFTELNPGSRAKRYMVGLGAGRSKICIAGRVADAEGETLVKFEDCRSGTMGWFGGRSEGMMSQDVYLSAQNLANFLSSWADGTLPKTATDKKPE